MAYNVIPVPHHVHLRHANEYPADLRFREEMLPETRFNLSYADRPRQVFWRGTTTGKKYADSKHAVRLWPKLYLHFTDRGRTVKLFRGTHAISNVWFTASTEHTIPDHAREEWMRPGTRQGMLVDWYQGGRVFLDVDGNSNAWESLRWKLLAGGPVLKINSTEGHVQWYYHLLQDGLHLKVVDLNRDDVLAEASRLLDDHEGAAAMIRAAMRLSIETISALHAREYLDDSILRCWERQEMIAQRDWRIRKRSKG